MTTTTIWNIAQLAELQAALVAGRLDDIYTLE
jgi:hypothetical protein